MSFGTSVTVKVNAVDKILPRINQDSYGSEYLLRETTEEYRMKIRHAKESPSKSGTVFDRHNVELTHVVFKTATTPEVVRVAYVVLRNVYDDDATKVGYIDKALADFIVSGTVIGDLIGWQN